jgi:NADP-dependent aldehyde dehydrogenase
MAICRAVAALDFPEGWFSMIHGSDPGVSIGLVQHPAIKAVGFTGSRQAGRALYDAAASRPEPIPVYAEMGSVNPVFVLPGALKERGAAIAEGLQQSVTMGVGQFCTNPGLVVGLHDEHLTEFIGMTAEKIGETASGTMLHRGILGAYEKGLTAMRETAGVTVAATGTDGGGTTAAAAVLTTEAETFALNPELSDEVFGPSTLIVQCKTKDQLLEVARNLEGHLTATIHGAEADLEEYHELVSILERKVGRLLFNGFPTGVEVCPSMHHGGPWPATTDVRSTSVGTAAIQRFARPICYQNFPEDKLPAPLRDGNVMGLFRMIDGKWTTGDVA